MDFRSNKLSPISFLIAVWILIKAGTYKIFKELENSLSDSFSFSGKTFSSPSLYTAYYVPINPLLLIKNIQKLYIFRKYTIIVINRVNFLHLKQMKSREAIGLIPTKKKTAVLQSVQNGLQILKLFTSEKPAWRLTEIANTLQLNKSTVSRLLSDLMEEGFLQKEGRNYSLGFSLLSISGVITSHLEVHRESKDLLKRLVDDLGETAHIAILEGIEITYVHKMECSNPVPLLSSTGTKNPVTCTSAGKILLAFHKKPEIVDRIIDEGLPRRGPNSPTDPEVLKAQLNEIRKQGYAICIDEMHENVVSIAAPVRDYTDEVIAAVSVVGTRDRIDSSKIEGFTARIIEAANEVSKRLGYFPGTIERGGWSEISSGK